MGAQTGMSLSLFSMSLFTTFMHETDLITLEINLFYMYACRKIDSRIRRLLIRKPILNLIIDIFDIQHTFLRSLDARNLRDLPSDSR